MKLPALAFNTEELSRFIEALNKEWLVTNGLGGYASSTLLGVNTRKYHGLLVAALNPPGERTACLLKLDEDVSVGGDLYRLGANEFAGSIYPNGYTLLTAFSAEPFPKYTYRAGAVELSKTVFMPKGKNVVSVIYKVANHDVNEGKLRVYPMLSCRHFHAIINRGSNPLHFVQKSTRQKSETVFQNPAATIVCHATDGEFHEEINWVDGLFYRAEAERGETSRDDCFQPGYFDLTLPAVEEKVFAVSVSAGVEGQTARELLDSVGKTINEVNASFNMEQSQRRSLLYGFYGLHPDVPLTDWLSWILLAADSFIVANATGKKAVIAGYHWFEPWGRDTFVSLPGLLLITGRFNAAKTILQSYNLYCKEGIVPNFIADKSGEPAYNTVDGTLWYVNAVLQYLKYTSDYSFVEAELWENLQAVISRHEQGTSFGIRLDDDGLLMHGPRLTWMDAEVNGEAVTPRAGKAVEIQALWYNALCTMRLLAERFGEKSLDEKYKAMANKAGHAFNEKFWNPKLGCLFDVLEPGGPDASIRPNQILGLSLEYPILDQARWKGVVDVVNRELVTVHGLRTLSPSDPKFIGKCLGDRTSRDRAYHNGTIWPWLLGPYISAYLKTQNNDESSHERLLQKLVLPFFTVGIRKAGLGTVGEICDSDLPNLPRGCISQAWSIAEPLRAYVEDILQVKPVFR
ncbi:MAG: amylo-alpha-1,6-glucosidase [Candidatus Bathyarchaeia archaeon]|jgi:predicted glycogen debranching enzyme